MRNPFLERREHYLDIASRLSLGYQQADPFPHVVIDDFLPEELGRGIVAEFPDTSDPYWLSFTDSENLKLASDGVARLPPAAAQMLSHFNSAPFLEFLERLTGIEGLIPDPWFEGGGLHQIPRGGFLKIHADFNRHQRLNLDRRINALWYLNPDWKDEYGGCLELWDQDMQECRQRILPLFNRCVIFNTTDTSYHGHPEPLSCPEGWTRKSMALYYYSSGRPESEQSESHSTLFQVRPEEAQRQKSRSYRGRIVLSNCLESLASLAHKPAGALRRLSQAVRPKY